jgi:CubicO group peptidase (beta-lactamase class C family)
MRWYLLAAAVILTTQCTQAVQSNPDQLNPEMRREIAEVFSDYDRTNGPGCAVGVTQEGELVYARGFGIGTLDHNIPLSDSSVFYLASVSKQFTAAAVLVADQEGFLKLDDPVRIHIPEFPDYERVVTVRHLLHHTSGVRDYLTLMALAGIPYENVLTDKEMFGLITSQRELNFSPGAEFLYSNSGYVLLAEIVKRATGRSLREYAQEKIFQPLGMNGTHFHDDRTEIVRGRVFSYDPGADGSWRTNYLMNFDKVGDGGLYSSVQDLARWDEAFYEDLLGVPDFAERMYTRGVLSNGDTIPYARGLGVSPRRGLPRVAHGGGLMAFRTMIARYPKQRTSVITLCNVGSANSGRLSAAVEDVVLRGVFPEPEEVSDQPAETSAPGRAEVTIPELTVRAMAGSYRSTELSSTWVLEALGSDLILHHPSGDTTTLEPHGEMLLSSQGIQLLFVSEAGEVAAFVLDAGRVRNIRFDRVR